MGEGMGRRGEGQATGGVSSQPTWSKRPPSIAGASPPAQIRPVIAQQTAGGTPQMTFCRRRQAVALADLAYNRSQLVTYGHGADQIRQ